MGEQGLTVEWLLETHVHADHLSAAPYLQESSAAGSASATDHQVQEIFGKVFNEAHRVRAATAASSTGCSPTATPTRSAP